MRWVRGPARLTEVVGVRVRRIHWAHLEDAADTAGSPTQLSKQLGREVPHQPLDACAVAFQPRDHARLFVQFRGERVTARGQSALPRAQVAFGGHQLRLTLR